MNSAIRTKLSVMMFLEYVIYGAWLPLLGLYIGEDYLNFTPGQQAWVFNAFAIASLTGMFFGGQLADRYFAQEKFLAFSHLIGGLAMLGLAYPEDILAVLRPDAAALLLLRADDVGDQRDRVRQHQGRPEGFRLHPGLGHDRLDRRELAVHLHPDRLGESPVDGPGRRVRRLAGEGARDAQDRRGDGSGADQHLHGRGRRLAGPGRLLPDPAAHPAAQESGSSFAPLEAFKLLAVPSILVLFIVTFLDSLVHYCYFFWTSRYLPADRPAR